MKKSRQNAGILFLYSICSFTVHIRQLYKPVISITGFFYYICFSMQGLAQQSKKYMSTKKSQLDEAKTHLGNAQNLRSQEQEQLQLAKEFTARIKQPWEIIDYIPGTFEPKVVQRQPDGITFKIGDFVSNGTKMRGKITAFHRNTAVNRDPNDNDLVVDHTWSGVGMYLSNLRHEEPLPELPSSHQLDDVVKVKFTEKQETPFRAQILAVHFYGVGKVKYDLEIFTTPSDSTRIYNVDSLYVSPNVQ